MNPSELKIRIKKFTLECVAIVESLPPSKFNNVISNQIIRSACSVGANYRAACRSRSKAEFIAKIGIVIEEADESEYWIEMIEESLKKSTDQTTKLKNEASQLVAIFTASVKTAKASLQSKNQKSTI
ncbi:MAG: four helix bundle protein [Bacteroidetes bacterium]|nr:four helix bundle protein [Bacteroidota bacterium]